MTEFKPLAGSFRDPAARVYVDGDVILRGVDAVTLANFRALIEFDFFREEAGQERIVGTRVLDEGDRRSIAIKSQGWAGALEHDRLPLLSYPYEWTFTMLKDAALLHLDLLEESIEAGWILKDSTPYNVQFMGSAPIFIDIPSFVPRAPGDYWRGYRQFCMLFLYPLLLKAYRGIPFQGLLRASLDGLSPVEIAPFFKGFGGFRKGVLAHVKLPAALERRVVARGTNFVTKIAKPQSEAMVRGLVQSMRRIVGGLKAPTTATSWSEYNDIHSYDGAAIEEKKAFVAKAAAQASCKMVWDLGSNTGTFSELLEGRADYIISVDGDHECVEQLYLRLRARNGKKILPIVMNLVNPSPNQGWANGERLAFDDRNKPDLILSLALIHHICLTNNVPIPDFLDWLATTGARLIIEFVDRNDSMVREMLQRKSETHEDYNLANFERELRRRYEILLSAPLKRGERQIYYCAPLRVTERPGRGATAESETAEPARKPVTAIPFNRSEREVPM